MENSLNPAKPASQQQHSQTQNSVTVCTGLQGLKSSNAPAKVIGTRGQGIKVINKRVTVEALAKEALTNTEESGEDKVDSGRYDGDRHINEASRGAKMESEGYDGPKSKEDLLGNSTDGKRLSGETEMMEEAPRPLKNQSIYDIHPKAFLSTNPNLPLIKFNHRKSHHSKSLERKRKGGQGACRPAHPLNLPMALNHPTSQDSNPPTQQYTNQQIPCPQTLFSTEKTPQGMVGSLLLLLAQWNNQGWDHYPLL